MTKPIYTGSEWNLEILKELHDACQVIATEELGLNTYTNTFEIITFEQMLDAYTSIGMPVNYNHWSFGKQFVMEEMNYKTGRSGLAYELVINSDPCINYIMEENTATLQAVVIAHAGFGHNHFFKNNYLFKTWTNADAIIDYLVFARQYILDCEEKYGSSAVEDILDSCHALKYQGLDRYKRPKKLSATEERAMQEDREEYINQQINVLWSTTVPTIEKKEPRKFPKSPEENVLKFIEKNSPVLHTWQRELIRIVRKLSQYFYPQGQTKVMNEGFATWTHCYIMNRLFDKGQITEGAMLEFTKVNSSVIGQQPYTSKYYSGFNPYALGLAMFRDIERICTDPTAEDKEWFPDLIGQDYIEVIKDAVENYRDESFILQFLSPKVMRDFRMLHIGDHDKDYYQVANIHNDDGYKSIRKALAKKHEMGNMIPNIQVVNANLDTDRTIELHHYMTNEQKLHEKDISECLRHVKRLWGFEPILASINKNKEEVETYTIK